MDKRDIFFGEAGLTSTSANHIANMAKEFILAKSAMVEHLRFINRTMSVVAAYPGSPIEVSNGRTESELPVISQAYDDIYRAKALIAWLREAIKAKESFGSELREMDVDEFCKKMEIEIPKAPSRKAAMSEDEYYATLPMKDRARFYCLETKCAVLGQAIHPDGAFSRARNEMVDSIAEPRKLVVKNVTTFVEKIEPSLSSEALDKFFFSLQSTHREAQSELNTIKFACEKAMSADAIAKQSEYNAELREYNARMATISNDLALYRKKRITEISNLKIVVPDSLKPIYDKINGLGKQ